MEEFIALLTGGSKNLSVHPSVQHFGPEQDIWIIHCIFMGIMPTFTGYITGLMSRDLSVAP